MEEKEPKEEIQEEEYTIENEDNLSINLSIEEVEELNEEEIEILAQKVEYNIDKYEDMLVKAQNESLDEDELKELGFDNDEYNRLKELDKELYKHKRALKKIHHEKGLFAYLPVWCAIIGILVFVFNIYPINPLLVEHVLIDFSEKILGNGQYDGVSMIYVIYFVYIGIFYLTEVLSLVGLLIYALVKKDKNKMKSFYSYLVVTIIDIVALIPGLLSFINTMNNIK